MILLCKLTNGAALVIAMTGTWLHLSQGTSPWHSLIGLALGVVGWSLACALGRE